MQLVATYYRLKTFLYQILSYIFVSRVSHSKVQSHQDWLISDLYRSDLL